MNRKINLCFILLILILILLSWGCNLKQEEKAINGITVHSLTVKKGLYELPSWAPDGEKIAFVFDFEVIVAKPDSSSWIHTKIGNSNNFGPSNVIWGKPEEVIYDKFDPNKKYRRCICVRNLISKEEAVLITGLTAVSGVSYNNNKLLYGVDKEIFLYNFLDKTITKLNIAGYFPVWSPDGTTFAYYMDGINLFNINTAETKNIYKRKSEGETVASISWSPDGKWIAYRGGPSKETNGIYILPADGSSPPSQILNMDIAELSWSPKGDKILFTTINNPSYSKMHTMDLPEIYKVYEEKNEV